MVKLTDARRLFGDRGKDYQLSSEALAALALLLDDAGRGIAKKVLEAVDKENELRRDHGLALKRRIIAEDIWRVLQQ